MQALGISQVASRTRHLELGRTHCYSGEEQTRTLAALGVALRSVGLGLHQGLGRVALVRPDSAFEEGAAALKALHRVAPHLVDLYHGPLAADVAIGLLASGLYTLVLLDGVAFDERLVAAVRNRPPSVEVILVSPVLPLMLEGHLDLHSVHSSVPGIGFPGTTLIFGDGKGKTTSALGLLMRCLGNVFSGADTRPVSLIQLLKGGPGYSKSGAFTEDPALEALSKFEGSVVHTRWGDDRVLFKRVSPNHPNARRPDDYRQARDGWNLARRHVASGLYQAVLVDELAPALDLDLLGSQGEGQAEVFETMATKPTGVEFIATGRCWLDNPHSQSMVRAYGRRIEIRNLKHYGCESLRAGVDW